MDQYETLIITEDYFELYNPNLKLFELKMSQKYPLGKDFFRINHGKNYFSFFERLGEVHYIILLSKKTKLIVGTACCILRKNEQDILYWYLCDLKIVEKHRGQNLTGKLFMEFVNHFIKKTMRGYLISMDPGSEQIVHLINKIKNILPGAIQKTKLLIYSVTTDVMKQIEEIFEIAFDSVSYLYLKGIKDIILESTKKPIELYHLQHGAPDNSVRLSDVPSTATIMFCFPIDSPLKIILDKLEIQTDSSATILSVGMQFYDWHNILTSEI